MRIAGGTAWGLHHFSVTCDLKGDVQRCTRKSRETRGHLARTEAAGAETRGHAAGMECVSNVPGELRHDEPSIRTRHFCRIATPESNPISVSIEAPGDEKTRDEGMDVAAAMRGHASNIQCRKPSKVLSARISDRGAATSSHHPDRAPNVNFPRQRHAKTNHLSKVAVAGRSRMGAPLSDRPNINCDDTAGRQAITIMLFLACVECVQWNDEGVM